MELETLNGCLVCGSSKTAIIDSVANLQECASCRYVFVSPRPTTAELIRYYSKPSKYDDWISEEAARDELWLRRLKKMERTKKPGTIFDVGTGIGQFLSHARGFYTGVFGTEVSKSAIDIAKKKYGVDIMNGEVETMSISQTFDNVTLFHVLEHVPDPKRLLEKCRSLLTPGGILVIAVPNDLRSMELKIRSLLKHTMNRQTDRFGPLGISKIVLDGSVDEIHLSQFTPASLASLVTKSGFTVVENSLDPYFAKQGRKLAIHMAYYKFHSLLHRIFGINLYNTIWLYSRP
jgi:SAM-dependent methyltransferase